MAGTLLLVAMLAIIAVLLLKTICVVRSVEICGEHTGVSESEIVRASGIRFGKALSDAKEENIEKNINALGKVKYLYLERNYPNTIKIYVTERKPVAMLLHAGKILVLDCEGSVIEAGNEVPNTDLIYISNMGVNGYQIGSAVSANAEKLRAFAAIMEAIEYHSASGVVSEINLEDLQDIRIITRSSITVRIGDCEKIRNKIAWMKAVTVDLAGKGESGGVLDVSSAEHADYSPAV